MGSPLPLANDWEERKTWVIEEHRLLLFYSLEAFNHFGGFQVHCTRSKGEGPEKDVFFFFVKRLAIETTTGNDPGLPPSRWLGIFRA